ARKFQYKYDEFAGRNVDVYVIGVYIDHPEFGGRATWGPTFGGVTNKDIDGHGTHIAISALQYVQESAQASRRKGRCSVVNLSLVVKGSKPLDDALEK
ncbi:hypothetical protein C0995_006992, partial [Termitomyces sp. Mi166